MYIHSYFIFNRIIEYHFYYYICKNKYYLFAYSDIFRFSSGLYFLYNGHNYSTKIAIFLN